MGWLSDIFEAKRFIEIDLVAPQDYEKGHRLEYHTFKGDLLGTVSQLPDNFLNLVSICGLEEHSEARDVNREYLKALSRELFRSSKPSGVLLLDRVTYYDTSIHPKEVGFSQILLSEEFRKSDTSDNAEWYRDFKLFGKKENLILPKTWSFD